MTEEHLQCVDIPRAMDDIRQRQRQRQFLRMIRHGHDFGTGKMCACGMFQNDYSPYPIDQDFPVCPAHATPAAPVVAKDKITPIG